MVSVSPPLACINAASPWNIRLKYLHTIIRQIHIQTDIILTSEQLSEQQAVRGLVIHLLTTECCSRSYGHDCLYGGMLSTLVTARIMTATLVIRDGIYLDTLDVSV